MFESCGSDVRQPPILGFVMPRDVIGFPRRIFVSGKVIVALRTKMYRRLSDRCHQFLVFASAALHLDPHFFVYRK